MADGQTRLAIIERDTALRNAVIEAALDCVIMMDQDGIIIEFNPAAEKTFGYAREEAVGSLLAELIIPENLREAHQKGLSHYLSSGEHKVLNTRIEVPATNKAGDDLLVELAISPVVFGEHTFFSAYLRDITESRAAEDELRASEERFQSLFELSPDAIVVIDQKGRLVDVNSRACQLAGFSKKDMLNKRAREFLPNDAVSQASEAMNAASGRDTVNVQIDFLNAKGERVPTEVLGRQIDSASGPLYHGVIRDISERIASERQLRKAKEDAEQANAAKSDFLANMSHEMRTPLNGVIGSLSLVEQNDVDVETRSLIGSAERSAQTLLTLIDDLLDLSRIEAGEIELEQMVFRVDELSAIVSEVFRPLADEKELTLNTHVDTGSSALKADIGKIRQVLFNLVGNAIKFTQRGQVDVNIKHQYTENMQNLILEVRDTGIGISETDQSVLFDRFKQADSSRSKSHGGAGLGLSICKELVDIMGGAISLESAPGEGASFTVSIPVQASETIGDADDIRVKGLPSLLGHVLIAEDSETNAMVAMKMLDRLGLCYQHVTDGAAAIDAALTGSFDLVLMDVSMPNVDGLEATRILRERGFAKPIIAMTAHALRGDRDKALEIGMSDYITKPIRPAAFADALKGWLPEADIASESGNKASEISPLDTNSIAQMWEDDLETFAQIAAIFVEELTWRLDGLKQTEIDLEHHAHSLKGAAMNIGASELGRLAAELEHAANTGSNDRIADLVARILREAETVKTALQQDYIKGTNNA